MKLFAASLILETNTFSPIPTGLDDFTILRSSDRHNPDKAHRLAALKDHASAQGDEIIFSLSARAEPAGIATRHAYETLRDEVLNDLSTAGAVDIVILYLHGAMVAEGYDDCEGDLIARARAIVGPDVVIGVELDLHCHLSEQTLAPADIVITFKEYPHIDIHDRAIELYHLAVKARRGDIKPVMALFDCKMVGVYSTFTPVMRQFVEDITAQEATGKVLSVSFAHGFPWGDIPEAGGKVIVITDNDQTLAQSLARDIGMKVFALRHQIGFNTQSLEPALSNAAASQDTPVIVADQSDNPGGGAPSDSTFALQWLLANNIGNAAIGIVYDPQVVQLAKAAGVGATLALRLGGKMGPTSGQALDLSVNVLGLIENHNNYFQQAQGEPLLMPLGDTVALQVGGIDIIVSSLRGQCFNPKIFADFAIDLSQKQLVLVKSMNHFLEAFKSVSSHVIYMAAPGTVNPDITGIAYQRMATADKYPWNDNPHEKWDQQDK